MGWASKIKDDEKFLDFNKDLAVFSPTFWGFCSAAEFEI
jgi:hypothetical protein